MKNALVTAALAAILSTGAISTVTAMPVAVPAADAVASAPVELAGHYGQKFGKRRHYVLPRRVIVRSLRHRGFRHIRNIRLRHGDYVLHARGYRGPVRLVVDGRTARILSRKPLYGGWHRPGFSFNGHNGNFSYSFGVR
jgi:hypothetical protein